jgi:futalosine hydrolase
VTWYHAPGHEIAALITGVGMVATSSWCSHLLSVEQFDMVFNLGVCGSFRTDLEPGTVVHVVSDRLVELGAEDGDAFLTIQQMKLLDDDEFPFRGGRLVNDTPPPIAALEGLRRVDGITVSTVHGNDGSIARVTERFDPDVESMEGAAFMYSCLIHGVRFAQIRAVSNIVERRNRSAWKLEDAITSLSRAARRIVES